MRIICTRFLTFLLSCLLAQTVMAQQAEVLPFDNEPGLLGRHFLEGQFILMRTPEELRSVDSSMSGFSTTLNIPTPWNEMLPVTIGQDLFVSGMGLNYGGMGGFGGAIIEVDAELRSVSGGINTYVYLTNDIRPFVQLGVTCDATSIELSGGGFAFNDTDLESRILVNPGIELDLTDQVALRTTFDLDTDEGLNDTMYRVELIAWPTEWLYVRGGIAGDVEGDTVGGLIGAGLAW